MKTIRIAIAALAAMLLGGTAAQAAVLATGPGSGAYPTFTSKFSCIILNVGKKPIDITIEAIDYVGNITNSLGTTTLAPGQATSMVDVGGGGAICKFTTSGSAKAVRAGAIYSNNSRYLMAIPAS